MQLYIYLNVMMFPSNCYLDSLVNIRMFLFPAQVDAKYVCVNYNFEIINVYYVEVSLVTLTSATYFD